jgi:hypothetical protein
MLHVAVVARSGLVCWGDDFCERGIAAAQGTAAESCGQWRYATKALLIMNWQSRDVDRKRDPAKLWSFNRSHGDHERTGSSSERRQPLGCACSAFFLGGARCARPTIASR